MEEFNFDQNLNSNLYREIPRNFSSSTLTSWLKFLDHSGFRFAFWRAFRVSSSMERAVLDLIRSCVTFMCDLTRFIHVWRHTWMNHVTHVKSHINETCDTCDVTHEWIKSHMSSHTWINQVTHDIISSHTGRHAHFAVTAYFLFCLWNSLYARTGEMQIRCPRSEPMLMRLLCPWWISSCTSTSSFFIKSENWQISPTTESFWPTLKTNDQNSPILTYSPQIDPPLIATARLRLHLRIGHVTTCCNVALHILRLWLDKKFIHLWLDMISCVTWFIHVCHILRLSTFASAQMQLVI